MQNKKAWIKWIPAGAVLAIFGIAALSLGRSVRMFTEEPDRFFGMFCLFAILLAALLSASFVLLRFRSKRTGKLLPIEAVFALSAAVLGIMYNTLIPTMAVPDEDFHLPMALSAAGDLAGHPGDYPGMYYAPSGEEDPGFRSRDLNREYYDQYLEWLRERPKSGSPEWVQGWYRVDPEYNNVIYYPAGAFIDLARLLGFGYSMVLFLGRLGNLLVYILAGCYVLKKAPACKEVLFLVLLLPIAIQQACSFSGDSIVNSLALIMLGGSLGLAYTDKISWRTWVQLGLCAAAGLLLGRAKYGACIACCIPILLVVIRQWKKNRVLSLSALAVLVLAVAGGFGPALVTIATNAKVTTPPLGTRDYYTVGGLLQDPYTLFLILMNTIFKGTDSYWIRMMGSSLGTYSLQLPVAFILAFVPLILLALIPRDQDRDWIGRKERLVLFLTGFLGIGLASAGMLIGWTLEGRKIIDGIQGRYFLPFLIPLLLCIMPRRIRYKDGEMAHRWMVMLGIFLQALLILTLMYRARVI